MTRTCVALAALFLVTVPASAEARYGARTLKVGSTGSDVKQLQNYLTRVGFDTSADGHYGRGTARSQKSFEREQQRRADGKATRADQRLLRRVAKGGSTPTGDSSGGSTYDGDAGNPTGRATLSEDGKTAIAPDDAPQEVKDAISAANEITDKPYRYGGGHGKFDDSGYDCSGAVSYAMHGGGFLDKPLDSTGFMSWESAGKGTWITTYANSGHAYVVIAGLRFDTSQAGSGGGDGPRWRTKARSSSGYTARHPAGF
jgi:cell wall-associated NlpC family hydrolase